MRSVWWPPGSRRASCAHAAALHGVVTYVDATPALLGHDVDVFVEVRRAGLQVQHFHSRTEVFKTCKEADWDNDDDEVYLTVYVCKGCGYEWTAIADVRPLLEEDDEWI